MKMNHRRIATGIGLALVICAVTGCSKPQVGAEHVELISSLRTAASAQNPQWLETNAETIEGLHASGELDDEAHASFRAIIEAGRAGDWETAESRAISLQKAQRASSAMPHACSHGVTNVASN
jgi:hypothetical protein